MLFLVVLPILLFLNTGYQNSNGLSFAANVAPLDELSMYCYGKANNLGNNFFSVSKSIYTIRRFTE
jgi:hypothetical protein